MRSKNMMKKKRKDRHGEANPFFGKHHSDKTKRKIAAAKSGKFWWTNGEKCVLSESCPDGFVRGRTTHLIKDAMMTVELPAAAPKVVKHPDNDIPEEDRLSEKCKRRFLEAEAREHVSEDDLFIARYCKSLVNGRSALARKLHEERAKWCSEHGIDPNDEKVIAVDISLKIPKAI